MAKYGVLVENSIKQSCVTAALIVPLSIQMVPYETFFIVLYVVGALHDWGYLLVSLVHVYYAEWSDSHPSLLFPAL